jgi:hypothetical protein
MDGIKLLSVSVDILNRKSFQSRLFDSTLSQPRESSFAARKSLILCLCCSGNSFRSFQKAHFLLKKKKKVEMRRNRRRWQLVALRQAVSVMDGEKKVPLG